LTSWRYRDRFDTRLRVRYIADSKDRKTGPIPQTMTSPSTCPTGCKWYGSGCYAEFGVLGFRWRRTCDEGKSWGEFCESVKKIPKGWLWRHNVAGDLPGIGDRVDAEAMMALIDANYGRRGFTYTHKPLDAHNQIMISEANRAGFSVNISADNLDQADAAAALGIGPVCVVVPENAKGPFRTPGGRQVVICPAQTSHLTCETCGLCAVASRKSIVGFRAHGPSSKRVSLAAVQLELPLWGRGEHA